MTKKKTLLNTFYNKSAFVFACGILTKNNVKFEINDRSKQINFRVPQSGYFEADIIVYESDFDKAYNLLHAIGNN